VHNATPVGDEAERLMSQALYLHQQGKLTQTEPLCRQVLAASPGHAEALASNQKTLSIKPDLAQPHFRRCVAQLLMRSSYPRYRQTVRTIAVAPFPLRLRSFPRHRAPT
jgi:hypothetical protein